MVQYDTMICQECDWRDDNPDTNYRKCPECGASDWGKWVEKLFFNLPENRG